MQSLVENEVTEADKDSGDEDIVREPHIKKRRTLEFSDDEDDPSVLLQKCDSTHKTGMALLKSCLSECKAGRFIPKFIPKNRFNKFVKRRNTI